MGPISKEDNQVVSELKRQGILLKFDPKDLNESTKNGGVAVDCSDGDIDLTDYHRRKISHRPHEMKVFGGSLAFARSFRGFREAFAVGLLENLRQGMTLKFNLLTTLT
ncbi:hypothetical protein A3H66_01470 [Candidatus Falkowbacteria bacterium RIFCSPLOWO2_02_FULL_45_21]|uniref:Uncharacterized protein n=1 Tax=Candidatus Falkowbacteria bacterium RIFCSPLOWO2_02_FULL_45_21 TaxID=1797989 RepID=A0A1F5SBM6_9BACT|nr:MAG: hypothetical protein A3H66_01470 [Candidatus Falkowbacteria bacterium RIFCSPLOWO2_02_FULL_45_21]